MKKLSVVLGLALLISSASAQPNKTDVEAKRIFDEMRAKYSRLETFSHGKTIFIYDGKKTVSNREVAFRHPNRFSYIEHRPEGDWISISNGHTNYVYDAKQNKTSYFAMPMPPEKLGRVGIMQYLGGGGDLGPLLAGVDPFAPPWGEKALGFSLGKPEKINGVTTDAVVVHLDRGVKMASTYFIGQKDRLLYRTASTWKDGEKTHSGSTTFLDVRANPKIPIAAFAFIPPPGTRQAKPEEMRYERKLISRDVRVGEFPPPLTGVDLKGNSIDLKNYKGKVVLLDFWATWCGPCLVDLPFIRASYEKFHDQGFEIIGISWDEKREVLEKFISEKNMTWSQILDDKMYKGPTNQGYKVWAIPTTILIGRDGKIAAFNPQKLLLEAAIEKALSAPAPE